MPGDVRRVARGARQRHGEPQLAGPADGLPPGRHPELAVDRGRLGLDRRAGHVQPLTDLPEREVRRQQGQQPQLGSRQRRGSQRVCRDPVEGAAEVAGLVVEDAQAGVLPEDLLRLEQRTFCTGRVTQTEVDAGQPEQRLDRRDRDRGDEQGAQQSAVRRVEPGLRGRRRRPSAARAAQA